MAGPLVTQPWGDALETGLIALTAVKTPPSALAAAKGVRSVYKLLTALNVQEY